LDEIQIKRAKGFKVKSFSKDYTCHVSFLHWFIIYNLVFQIPHLTLHFRYRYILTKTWFYIMFIMNSCPFITHIYIYIWTTFVETTFSKSIILGVKIIFESNVLKWVIKTICINSSYFSLLIINVKILSNFQNEWCTFGKKKDVWKNKDCPFSRFECF
jgi:hypothetical protein